MSRYGNGDSRIREFWDDVWADGIAVGLVYLTLLGIMWGVIIWLGFYIGQWMMRVIIGSQILHTDDWWIWTLLVGTLVMAIVIDRWLRRKP